MDKKFKRTLVTCALPYANGPVHIGHLAGVYVPADIYVRYLRMRGEDVLYVCGSDEHGVPITLGLCIFLACVGLSSGKDFFNIVLTEQGCRWRVCGALITIVPTVICGLIGRYVLRLNFYTLLGMLAGINTNPPVLAYARDLTSADSPSVGYSAVFPFAMFLRVVAIQLFIFILG